MLAFPKQYSFLTGEISPKALGNSNSDLYKTALSASSNLMVGVYGEVFARPGTKYIAEVQNSTNRSYLYKFRYSSTENYILEFANQKIRFFKNQAILGAPYEVTSPYSSAEAANLCIAQSYDTLYITHPSYAPRKLVRLGDTSWTLSTVTFDEPAYQDVNESTVTLTPSGTTGSITFTASSATFASTDVGRSIRYLSGPDDTDALLYNNPGTSQIYFNIPFAEQTSADVEVFRLETTGAKTELTYTASSPGANEFSIASGQVEINSALTSGQQLLVQRKNTSSGVWGYATITAYTSTTQVTATVINTLSGTDASTLWRLGAWSGTTGYPAKCAFYNGRLYFFNTATEPAGMWATGIEDFENISPDNDLNTGLLSDDSPFYGSITEIINIDQVGSGEVLLLFGEKIKSINKQRQLITPTSIRGLIQTEENIPCSTIKPAATNNEFIFTDITKKQIRAIGYTFESASYRSKYLNWHADHLFETAQVQKIAYVDTPVPTIFVLRSDGTLVSGMYQPGSEKAAWTQHSFTGTIEDIEVISYNNSFDLYMVINRTIDGATARYVEVLTQPFYNDDQTTCTFLDSATYYSGSATTSITGLDHLEGEEVYVMGDDGPNGTYTVSGGEITLTTEVSNATIGLKYTISGETLPIDEGKGNGAAIGSKSYINKVYLDFYETNGCKIGYSSTENLQEIDFRPNNIVNVGYEPQTGIYEILLHNNNRNTAKIYFEQPYPLPFTLRSIKYKLHVTES